MITLLPVDENNTPDSSEAPEGSGVKEAVPDPAAVSAITKDSDSGQREGSEKERLALDYVRLFERFFDAFRRQVVLSYGRRSDKVVGSAEEKVRLRFPRFSLQSLGPGNVLSVLDLVETITNGASLFKRPKIRQAALAAVSDLYNRQYGMLERFQAVETVEQFYYRLKK